LTSLESSIDSESEGRLRTGSEGANLVGGLAAVGSSSSSSSKVDIRLGGVVELGDRIGEPLVMSESTEKRDTGLGFPKLSRLNRSGRGGVGLTFGAGAKIVGTDVEVDGTGLSIN
jgi:hypothetical protein